MTVTHFGWSVSSTIGALPGVQAILHVYKQRKLPSGRIAYQHGDLNDQVFESSEVAHAAALERGYTTKATRWPYLFIGCRLPRATRRFLKGKSQEEICLFLLRIGGGDHYVSVIMGLEKSNTFQRWMSYIQNPNFEAARYTQSV